MVKVKETDVEYDESDLEAECDCGSTVFRIEAHEIHYAKQICALCNGYIKFVPKPAGDRRKKSTKHSIGDIIEHRGYDEPRCFFCRRTAEQLGLHETLEVDHIKELKNESGEDRLDNLQILCTPCHKLKNWMRTYHNEHRQPFFEAHSVNEVSSE